MHDSGQIQSQNLFAGVPESGPPGRHSTTGESVQPPGPPARPPMTGAELRLRAWTELPERHRDEVCRQIRRRCEAFVASIRLERIARKSEADGLVSEVVAHLLRATSLGRDEPPMIRASPHMASPGAPATEAAAPWPWLAKGRLDERDPAGDARVSWLIEETCNRQALFHRFEDMRRRERGGKWDGAGYPMVAVDAQTIEHLSGHYDPAESEADSLAIDDSRRAWDGLVKLAAHQFGPDDDVVALVRVLGSDGETQDAFGTQWPIGKIVRALNGRGDDASWNDDRVENAKRRLTRCIAKIKRAHGLDAVDLHALLARYSREHDRLARDARARGRPLAPETQ
jgi:hypothetical protein